MKTKPAHVATAISGSWKLLGRHVGEVPLGRHVLQRAVDVPGEAVVRAAELAAVTVVLLQLAAAVQAGVRVGLDLVLAGADDDVRPADDVVGRVVADLRDVLLPAGELPHPGPQPLLLLLVPSRGGVSLDRDVLVAEELRRLESEHPRHLVGVGVEELLVAQPGGPGRRRVVGHLVTSEAHHGFPWSLSRNYCARLAPGKSGYQRFQWIKLDRSSRGAGLKSVPIV